MIDFGLLLLRLAVGLTVAAHGGQKLFGWFKGPGLAGTASSFATMRLTPALGWALIAGLAEFVGGLLIALGLLDPIGSALVLAVMIVAIALVHARRGFWNAAGGYEYPLTLAAAAVALALTGPGRFALDSRIGWSLGQQATVLLLAAAVVGALIGIGSTRVGGSPQPTTGFGPQSAA